MPPLAAALSHSAATLLRAVGFPRGAVLWRHRLDVDPRELSEEVLISNRELPLQLVGLLHEPETRFGNVDLERIGLHVGECDPERFESLLKRRMSIGWVSKVSLRDPLRHSGLETWATPSAYRALRLRKKLRAFKPWRILS